MKKIRPNSNKLNLGSGNEYRAGWINIDMDPKWEPDILCDIEDGIPLKDNSIDFVFIKHVLEHIDQRKFKYVMSEISRVCRKRAKIVIYVPYFSCNITYRTIGHVSPMTYYTFDWLEKFKVKEKEFYFFRKSFGYRDGAANKITKMLNPIMSFLPNKLPLIYERFFCWIYPMEELKVVLETKK
jgi:hypothetical protein